MKYCLAIHTQHLSTVALYSENTLMEVVSEERFTNEKNDTSFPIKSISYILKKYSINELQEVVFASNFFKIFETNYSANRPTANSRHGSPLPAY